MKHTIEIEGLPEGYEIKKVKVTHGHLMNDGTMMAVVAVKKKQPRRIVLEETNYEYDCEINGAFWRIVEDSGENDD